MGKFLGGFLLASGLAIAAHLSGLLSPKTADCGGYCGEGSQCEEDRCIPLVPATDDDATDDDAGPKKTKRKRRRRRRGAQDAEGADETLPAFVPVDDSNVPRFDRNVAKTIDLNAGAERLTDLVINRELAKLDRRFERCIGTAADHSEAAIKGILTYELGIAGTGKVTGVNVQAPASLKVFGIVPCVRKAVYGHRFPSFDGATMGVEGSFKVD